MKSAHIGLLRLCLGLLIVFTSVSLNAAALNSVSLRDQFDRKLTLPNGRVWLVTFIFTSCRGACPALMQNITAIETSLPESLRSQIEFGAITFDPETDKPATLKEYGIAHHFTRKNNHLLTGNPEVLKQVYDAFKFDYKHDPSEGLQHTNLLAIMDKDGNIVQRFYGMKPNVNRVNETIKSLLK